MQILALAPEASCTWSCLDAAVAAAISQPHSRIMALHVRVEPLELFASDEEVAIQRLRDAREGKARDRAAGTRLLVEEWKKVASPELSKLVTYEELVGSEEEQVLLASREAELLVMARPNNLDGHDAFHAAVFLARKTLLLVPRDWRLDVGDRLARHVLISWKQSDQAVRAVHGAMPWLKAADQVTILTVRQPGQPSDPCALLEVLAREGIEAQLIEAEPIDGRTSTRILATAGDIKASLLVMGAYRHGALVEWALGATTQRTIAQAEIALMLAH